MMKNDEKKLSCAMGAMGRVGFVKNQKINQFLNADAPDGKGEVIGAHGLEKVQDALLEKFQEIGTKPLEFPAYPKEVVQGSALTAA